MKMHMEHITKNLPKAQTLARKKQKKTRFYIDNEFLAWGYAAAYRKSSLIDVYCVLAKYANYSSQLCFPSYETIIRETGLKNRNAVKKALDKLEELKIVRIFHSKGRGSNKYILQDVSLWVKERGITGDTVERYQSHHGVHRI